MNWEIYVVHNSEKVRYTETWTHFRQNEVNDHGAPTPICNACFAVGTRQRPCCFVLPRAVPGTISQMVSRVAPYARNGACTVRGGGSGLMPRKRRNPTALSHACRRCPVDRCERETDARHKCLDAPDLLKIG